MTLQKPVLIFILLYCLKCCFKLEQCKESIILQCRELRTEHCSESLLLLLMAFNTILKTVKQKITHCISVSACVLSTITGEFSGLTGIVAAISKKVKVIFTLQELQE